MKEYKPKQTNASMTVRYALMAVGVEAVCAYVLLHSVGYDVSVGRLSMLTVLYNVIAVVGRMPMSVFADRVSSKHTGVRLGTMLILIGYYLPVSFGVNFKVVTLALGSCIFHSFAASQITTDANGRSTGIALFLAGSTLGLALTAFAPFLGHIGAILMTICAIPDDNSPNESAPVLKNGSAPSGGGFFAAILLLTTAYMLIFYEFSSFSFPWNTFFKTQLVTSVAIAAGRALGGILSDRIGRGMTVICSIVSGTALICFCSGSRALGTLGLLLLSMSLAPLFSAVQQHFPAHGGFVFAVFSTAAYFGQELTFYAPMKKEWQVLVVALAVILAVTVSELPRTVRALKRREVSK